MPKYEDFCGCKWVALGVLSARDAASKCGYDRPTIFVAPDNMGYGEQVAQGACYNVSPDAELSGQEWYVEYNGKRYGSLGA
jgi:hypothetical protein